MDELKMLRDVANEMNEEILKLHNQLEYVTAEKNAFFEYGALLHKQLEIAVEAMKEARLNINSGKSALFSKEVMYIDDAKFYFNNGIKLIDNALAEIEKIKDE